MKRIIFAVSAMLAGGCASAPQGPDTTNWMYEPHTLTAQQSSAVQSAVSGQLKDPESARYSDLRSRKVIMPGGKVAYQVCGYVNSKNSFGGYVGKTPFAGAFPWSQPDRFQLTGVGQDWRRTGVLEGCAMLGLPLPA